MQGEGVMKQYKTNPNILPTHEEEELANNATHASATMPKSANTSEAQFMGKRNQHQVQQTAPTANRERKTKANTINVDELNGGVHNPQP